MRKRLIFTLGAFWLLGLAQLGSATAAELRGHWTLDNLTTGIQNQGTDGSTSDMTSVSAPSLTAGIIGGALDFNGTTNMLRATIAGNVADDLTGYPYSLSVWINKSNSDGAGDPTNIAVGMSDISANGVHYGVGLETASGSGAVLSRNSTFTSTELGPNIVDGNWHHLMGVFNASNSIQLYVDGVLVGTDTGGQSFNNNVDSLFIGGNVRNSTQNITRYGGKIDDAGFFDDAVTASDVALVNGLGRIGGFDLSYLDEAQDLLLAGIGSTAEIGGYTWRYVDSLGGTTGDYGGSLASNNAFIVTGGSGEGLLQVAPIPEPSCLLLTSLGLMAIRRKRRQAC